MSPIHHSASHGFKPGGVAPFASVNAGVLESNHRIANSLQLVSAMLSSQGRELSDPIARDALERSVQRVSAIAGVHRQLYLTQGGGGVDVATYLLDLIEGLQLSFSQDAGHRPIHLQVEQTMVPEEFAAIIGVIVTELVINACKYAYLPEQPGGVEVILTTGPERLFSLLVRDQGGGMKGCSRSDGLGNRLLELLTRKLDAHGSYSISGPGTTYSMSGFIPV